MLRKISIILFQSVSLHGFETQQEPAKFFADHYAKCETKDRN